MSNRLPEPEPQSRSFLSTVVAVLVLIVAGWLLLHFLVHLAVFLASIVVVIVAIVGVVWAVRTLL